jgi:tRNA(Arg) A34 adenosine deaminase TadA
MGVTADSAPSVREQIMRVALEMARRSLAAGGAPVGACIAESGAIVARGHNSVVAELDPTAHAEIVVLRAAGQKLRRLDLSGCSLYVTLEPCAMCLAACYYSGLDAVFYGAPIASMAARTGHELCLAPAQLFAGTDAAPAVTGGVLAAECEELIRQWTPGSVMR